MADPDATAATLTPIAHTIKCICIQRRGWTRRNVHNNRTYPDICPNPAKSANAAWRRMDAYDRSKCCSNEGVERGFGENNIGVRGKVRDNNPSWASHSISHRDAMIIRKPLFSVTTPIPHVLREVVLYEDTWEHHIVAEHQEMSARVSDVQRTAEYPTVILDSFSTAGNYLFINQEILDEEGNSSRVPIKPIKSGLGLVVSAYFSGNVTSAGTLFWHRFMKPAGDK